MVTLYLIKIVIYLNGRKFVIFNLDNCNESDKDWNIMAFIV